VTVERLRSQHGIALPAALMILFILSLLGAALVHTAVSSGTESSRDRNVKRAVAAADAGIDVALYRLNKLTPSALQCVVIGTLDLMLEPLLPDDWCRVQNETLDSGAIYSYRVSGGTELTLNGQKLLQRKIISTGVVGGVERRVLAVVGSAVGTPLFGGHAVMSDETLRLTGGARVAGSAASNGDVSLASTAEICGDITYGPGKQLITSGLGHQCPGYAAGPASQPFLLNPVDQGNAPTDEGNDNDRFGSLDPWTLPLGITWNPASRALVLKNGSTLTLTGNVYSLCRLEISNGAQLIIAPRNLSAPPLRIYIDEPENCGSVAGAGSVELGNLGSITNVNSNPATLNLYVVGSSAGTPTSIEFSNSSAAMSLLVYAPRSSVSLENGAAIIGAVAAKSVSLAGTAQVTWHQGADEVSVPVLQLFRRQSWTECSARKTAAAVDSGC
jgi:hypothetical protein